MSVRPNPYTPAREVSVPPQEERSPYHLTSEQIDFFDQNGYLVLRNWIPAELLERLQQAGDGWIEQGWRMHDSQHLTTDAGFDDYVFSPRPDGDVMFRVNYLHNKGYPASLELLGCPQVLAVAESLSGENFVPTYEAMVFKQQGDGVQIRWHQDAVHPRNYRIYNYDLYLDASRREAGALHVVPKTHLKKQDFCNIEHHFGWEVPDSIQVEMEPGDVLIHDVMVAHGSPATVGKALRRTIYYEFRAAEEILDEGPWDRAWIDRRLRLVPLALERYRQAFPQSPQFKWRIHDDFRPQTSGDEAVELKVAHLVHMSGAYCSAGDAGKS